MLSENKESLPVSKTSIQHKNGHTKRNYLFFLLVFVCLFYLGGGSLFFLVGFYLFLFSSLFCFVCFVLVLCFFFMWSISLYCFDTQKKKVKSQKVLFKVGTLGTYIISSEAILKPTFHLLI